MNQILVQRVAVRVKRAVPTLIPTRARLSPLTCMEKFADGGFDAIAHGNLRIRDPAQSRRTHRPHSAPEIVLAQLLLNYARYFAQHLVADFVPKGVVDQLKVVEVQHHHLKRAVRAALAPPPAQNAETCSGLGKPVNESVSALDSVFACLMALANAPEARRVTVSSMRT